MKVPTSTACRAPVSRTSMVSSSPSSWVICMPAAAAELAVGLLGEVAQHLVGGFGVGEQVVVDGGRDDVHAAQSAAALERGEGAERLHGRYAE